MADDQNLKQIRITLKFRGLNLDDFKFSYSTV